MSLRGGYYRLLSGQALASTPQGFHAPVSRCVIWTSGTLRRLPHGQAKRTGRDIDVLDQPGSDEPMRSGGGGRGRGGGNGGGDGRGDGGEGRGPLAGAVLLGVWVAASLLGAFEGLWDRSDATIPMDTSRMRVSIVIPCLNEETTIGDTLSSLKRLDPAPAEVIVVDGGSSDATAQIAAKNGARVIRSPIARRSSQMNMGARAAVGDAVLFLHADTSLPENAVSSVRTALSDTSAVLGAFPASFAVGGKRMPAAELQSAWKTHYLPALLRPRSYARGLRVVLGDQAMFARKKDLLQQDVGGFDERLAIMEDLDLCLRLHSAGPAWGHAGTRGRVVLAKGRVTTSGRRIKKFGNTKITAVHVVVGMGWYLTRAFPWGPSLVESLAGSMYRNDVR